MFPIAWTKIEKLGQMHPFIHSPLKKIVQVNGTDYLLEIKSGIRIFWGWTNDANTTLTF